jgi:hypothetical protein
MLNELGTAMSSFVTVTALKIASEVERPKDVQQRATGATEKRSEGPNVAALQ